MNITGVGKGYIDPSNAILFAQHNKKVLEIIAEKVDLNDQKNHQSSIKKLKNNWKNSAKSNCNYR